jgi:hypothetical protein
MLHTGQSEHSELLLQLPELAGSDLPVFFLQLSF